MGRQHLEFYSSSLSADRWLRWLCRPRLLVVGLGHAGDEFGRSRGDEFGRPFEIQVWPKKWRLSECFQMHKGVRSTGLRTAAVATPGKVAEPRCDAAPAACFLAVN